MTSEPNKLVSFLTPPDLRQMAADATKNLLPEKSKPKYENSYQKFSEWRQKHNTQSTSANVLLVHSNELSEKYKPTSLWSHYSMLKTTLKLKEKIDISHYNDLTAMLKRKSEGFKSKKSNVLTPENINKFLNEAPNDEHLDKKVILVFGICGACRKKELVELTIHNVREEGNRLVVDIEDTKMKRPRYFTIRSEFSEFVKKYQALRPPNVITDRFFLNYRDGRCTVQPIGINKIAKVPQNIAKYLNLKQPASYTGHSFWRNAATLVADTGADITTIKRFGDWKSTTVAEGYIQESIPNKAKISNVIESAVALSSTSKKPEQKLENQEITLQKPETIINVEASTSTAVNSSLNAPIFKFENCSVTIVNNYTHEK